MGRAIVPIGSKSGSSSSVRSNLSPAAIFHTSLPRATIFHAPNNALCQIGLAKRCIVRTASTSTSTAASAATSGVTLPPDLRNATAILKLDNTDIYILGVSHVSKVSLDHIRALISTVQPDTVIVELCKDRIGLLVDENAPPPQSWHTPRISIVGYRPQPGWPTASDLIQRLKGSGESPVSASEIEDDAVTLLSTGLFGSVRPVANPPTRNGAPTFLMGPSGRLTMVAPLGGIEYVVTERKLPLISDFQIDFATKEDASFLSEQVSSDIKAAALSSAATTGTLAALLNARAAVLQALPASQKSFSVSFSGVYSGRIVAKVISKASRDIVTGLEGSVVKGQGTGITPFRRQSRQDVQRQGGTGLQIMLDDGNFVNSSSGNVTSSANLSSLGDGSKKEAEFVVIAPWTDAEVAAGAAAAASSPRSSAGGLSDAFASIVTQQYAKYQAAAGRAVGIGTGAAWQVALQAGAQCGARQVLLGDRPASVTGLRLAQGIWRSSAPFLLGSIPAAIAGAIITTSGASDALQGSPAALAAPVVAVVLPLAAAMWPILAPLLEIQRFSKMSAAEIEETVRIKELLQNSDSNSAAEPYFLWGEDALIKWPGALDPIINERDDYMARAIAAAALGRPQGLTPAFVRAETSQGSVSYRYAMPKGGDEGVCPVGAGDGQFELARSSSTDSKRKIVAVVGTAHVRGMLKVWPQVSRSGADLSLKEFL